MFTGLVEDLGTVLWIRATDRGTQLQISAPRIAEEIRKGDSVAVNGCCLTVSAHRGRQLTFDLLQETLDRTNLRFLRRDGVVNLERALAADGRIGGHFVQGHVDCAAPVVAFELEVTDHRLEIELPGEFSHYVADKGSITVNGINLTIAKVSEASFAAWVIPHTKRHTNLDGTEKGDCVNIECDILAKYLERMLPHDASQN